MGDGFLAGKTAMITGGASGMGLAMAVAFASEGANVSVGSLLAGASFSDATICLPPRLVGSTKIFLLPRSMSTGLTR